jgi:homogentisate 1,2-dioxygenase
MPGTEAFFSADGDMLIVPQTGNLDVHRAWAGVRSGRVYVRLSEILVVPQGIRYNVSISSPARGYILETYTAAYFELPELGLIGSNELANARDFQIPRADYVDSEEPHKIMA